ASLTSVPDALQAVNTLCNLSVLSRRRLTFRCIVNCLTSFQECMVRTSNRLPEFRVDIRTFKVVIIILVGLAAIVGTWALLRAEPVNVGAPPSLRAAFSDILPLFVQEYGVEVHVDYTPSKRLLHQIEKGVPIDVFLSAGVEEVEYLHKKGLTLNGRPRIYAQTALVLVMSAVSTDTMVSFPDAMQNHTTPIAPGDPPTSYFGDAP